MSQQRRLRARALLAERRLDALLVTTLTNVRYLTGFTGSSGELLLTPDGEGDVFVTDGRYTAQAALEVADLRRLVAPGAGWLGDTVGSGARLGLEDHAVPWSRARSVAAAVAADVVPAGRVVEQLRQVKDDDEVALLRRACAIADDAFADLLGWLRPGMTERDVAVRLERGLVDRGAGGSAFSTIVASGPNSAIPHHRPAQRTIERGDVVKLDFGALVDGYHSDMTRMVALGPPPSELGRVYDVVRGAQEAGLRAARDGAETGDVDAACRTVIAAAGHAEHFSHGTGHGIGLDIHEDPFLRPREARPGLLASPSVTLRAGMAVTVEPGVYLPGVGGVRIEDSVVITPSGPDVLTQTPKDLVVL